MTNLIPAAFFHHVEMGCRVGYLHSIMKQYIILLIAALAMQSCNSNLNQSSSAAESETQFVSKQQNGRWSTDFATAEELKGMHYTIENFTLLNRKKFENLQAYQEFGNLMQMHIDRVTTHCQLDANSKSILCRKLDRVKTEIKVLHGNDMEKSKISLHNINSIFSEIDSTFSYMN
jgi:PBP1b-binding outer membrane lipoprotein LpoB